MTGQDSATFQLIFIMIGVYIIIDGIASYINYIDDGFGIAQALRIFRSLLGIAIIILAVWYVT